MDDDYPYLEHSKVSLKEDIETKRNRSRITAIQQASNELKNSIDALTSAVEKASGSSEKIGRHLNILTIALVVATIVIAAASVFTVIFIE